MYWNDWPGPWKGLPAHISIKVEIIPFLKGNPKHGTTTRTAASSFRRYTKRAPALHHQRNNGSDTSAAEFLQIRGVCKLNTRIPGLRRTSTLRKTEMVLISLTAMLLPDCQQDLVYRWTGWSMIYHYAPTHSVHTSSIAAMGVINTLRDGMGSIRTGSLSWTLRLLHSLHRSTDGAGFCIKLMQLKPEVCVALLVILFNSI